MNELPLTGGCICALEGTKSGQEPGVNLGVAKFHIKNVMTKLAAKNRAVAVKAAQEEGLL